ncbi:MAG: FHA domain-containing protein [Bdellovibrionales bacterium]
MKVKIFDANGTQVHPVAKSTLTVGSAAHCDIVLDHPSMDGEHVRAWLEGGRIWVQDLGTGTGTFLNGIRLPPLKPMLVRDLDILKMGECPATLGLEVNLVRAPVVKTRIAMDEITLTDIKPLVPKDSELESKREELAAVSRELAELKLQLQMGRMEKETDDQSQQIKELRADNEKLVEHVHQLEREKSSHRKVLETEIAELKLKALRDLKDLKDEEARKFATWKVNLVSDLTRNLRDLSLRKGKAWDGRAVDRDLMMEWEAEMNHFFRRWILDEHEPQPVHQPLQSDIPTQQIPVATSERPLLDRRSGRPRRRQRSSALAMPAAVTAAALTAVMGIWFVVRSFRSPARPPAGVVALAPAPASARAPAQLPPASTPARAVPHGSGSKPAATRPSNVYQPAQTSSYKTSYTDNTLYTLGFLESEMKPDFRKGWLAELNRTAQKDWKLKGPTVTAIATQEMALLRDLQKLQSAIRANDVREGIKRMRQREDRFEQDLERLLGNKALLAKFLRLKRDFYSRHVARLSQPARGRR